MQWPEFAVKVAPVSTNVMVRDLDVLAPQALDSRRLEVVAEGIPLFGCMQLAIDATLVSPLHCDGAARPGAAHIDGIALHAARRRKERTYPELVAPRSRSRLVVLGGEVGGRWSEETSTSVRLLAKAKARPRTFHLAHSDGTGMAEPLGRSSSVCCWSCSREFLVGSPWGWWR